MANQTKAAESPSIWPCSGKFLWRAIPGTILIFPSSLPPRPGFKLNFSLFYHTDIKRKRGRVTCDLRGKGHLPSLPICAAAWLHSKKEYNSSNPLWGGRGFSPPEWDAMDWARCVRSRLEQRRSSTCVRDEERRE